MLHIFDMFVFSPTDSAILNLDLHNRRGGECIVGRQKKRTGYLLSIVDLQIDNRFRVVDSK